MISTDYKMSVKFSKNMAKFLQKNGTLVFADYLSFSIFLLFIKPVQDILILAGALRGRI